ncbi:Astrotactin-2 [Chelonia mydas]|uniref:Astrotactin-2 n=1 Tax=Chelonia mydas TaxID=8469 RepID=M7BJJ3_CHEMY|nr:Astrotactin-2 [Chelonia mydas]
MPIRETPILDDYDFEDEDEVPQQVEPGAREDEFGSQVTRTLESLGRGGEEKPEYEKKALAEVLFAVLDSSPPQHEKPVGQKGVKSLPEQVLLRTEGARVAA